MVQAPLNPWDKLEAQLFDGATKDQRHSLYRYRFPRWFVKTVTKEFAGEILEFCQENYPHDNPQIDSRLHVPAEKETA